MPAEFRWIMTAAGLAKRAAAEAGEGFNPPVTFAVGDGGGVYHEPEELLAGLINQVWSGPVNRVYRSPADATLAVVEALIPANVGGWTIREAALIDAEAVVIAVGKYPATVKPAIGSGGEKEIYVRGGLRVSNGGDVILEIGSSLVMATQEYVDAGDLAHASLFAAHGATAAATAGRLPLRDVNQTFKVGVPQAADDVARLDTVTTAIAALVNSAPAALDTLHELATALGDDPNFSATVIAALAAKETPAGAQAKVDALWASIQARRFISGPFTWTANTIAAVEHNLGVVPYRVSLVAECISAEHGFNVGDFAYDLVFLMGTYAGLPRFNPVTVRASDTHLYFAAGDTEVCVINQVASNAADPQQITAAKWNLYLCAER